MKTKRRRQERAGASRPGTFKRVLYYVANETGAEHFFETLGGVPDVVRGKNATGPTFRCGDTVLGFVVEHDACKAYETLHRDYFNLVLLDLRTSPARGKEALKDEVGRAQCILDKLDEEPDVELRYGFHRILVLVSGPDSLEVDDLIASLGARGVGRVMRDTAHCHLDPTCPRLPHHSHFGKLALDEMLRMIHGRRRGSRALCLAGGGITGIYFELGALKCLEDCLGAGAVNSFDLYYGISAGAVVGGFLANGYSPTEVMAGIAGDKGGRIPPFSLSLLRASHLNLAGVVDPALHLLRGAATAALRAVLGERKGSLETLFLEYTDLLVAPFSASGFESMLRRVFSVNGATNDFRNLPRPLKIGATDQDQREHVLFGRPPFDDVPISKAIQASISINPFFCATRVGDRYYTDGIVTRTSNFVEAIKRGSDLIFALDPFVPYVSRRAGFAAEKGVIYNADQDIRTVSFTRFETTRYWVLRRHPEVSLYSFLPANRLRKLLSVNPMDHRPYLQIWRGAYLSTLKRIQKVQHRMRGDLAFHGIPLDTSRAEEVALRLDSVVLPTFADFFPGQQVEVVPPPRPERREPAAEEPVVAAGLGPTDRADAA